jgi:3-oxoacyl-[acyl-carrier protein] reductase/meso-butanediol dehydrogenase/(S,S)-butanediol dehydrogenase/diacetyl reductase
MYDLAGKVALVTGTGNRRGIGRAIAVRLAREGADVAVNDRPLPAGANPWSGQGEWRGVESVADEIRALGRRSLVVLADVTDRSQVQAMVDRVVNEFGRIDILVNNAKWLEPIDEDGGTAKTNVVDMTDEMWTATLAVNLTGPLYTCQAAARHMIRQGEGGKIINIASLKGKRGKEGRSAVCASKGGLIRLTETLALELGRHNINVNAICPGATVTFGSSSKALAAALAAGMSEEDAIEELYVTSGRYPAIGALGRPGRPEDQAAAAAFLASREADFITGQAINVCGGQLMGI